MRAGLLRHRITLKQPVDPLAQNTFGEEVEVYRTAATVWANVEATAGDESVTSQVAAAMQYYKVTLRYFEGLAPTWRVVWSGHTLEVSAVLTDGMKREMKLICSEVV
jgi:head-tail adaptor